MRAEVIFSNKIGLESRPSLPIITVSGLITFAKAFPIACAVSSKMFSP